MSRSIRRCSRICLTTSIAIWRRSPRSAMRRWCSRPTPTAPTKPSPTCIAAAKAQAGRARRLHARLWQHQSAGSGIDRAQYRHQIRARAVQGRCAGGAGAGSRRHPARHLGEFHGRAACRQRPHPRACGDHGASASPLNPEWPTLQEEGAGDINASNWTALLAPKGTPQPIIDKLNAKVVEILAMPDVKERFAAGGVATIPSTPAELDARIKREARDLSGHHREGQRPRRLAATSRPVIDIFAPPPQSGIAGSRDS